MFKLLKKQFFPIKERVVGMSWITLQSFCGVIHEVLIFVQYTTRSITLFVAVLLSQLFYLKPVPIAVSISFALLTGYAILLFIAQIGKIGNPSHGMLCKNVMHF